MATERQKAIARALTAEIPRAPYLDAQAIRDAAGARHLRGMRPHRALWLAAVAHIRHCHTEYDALRDGGYGLAEARFFVVDATNEVLGRWGSRRLLRSDPEDEAEEIESSD